MWVMLQYQRHVSAPRMWRCFFECQKILPFGLICSTHVEMFLGDGTSSTPLRHLLHACGDVSNEACAPDCEAESAPRMWRCFYRSAYLVAHLVICSTHVEMFLFKQILIGPSRNLLHACGDVSVLELRDGDGLGNLLHACGDVSDAFPDADCLILSAPRMWRCFPESGKGHAPACICSTHVEMFPPATTEAILGLYLLHACGDVSQKK